MNRERVFTCKYFSALCTGSGDAREAPPKQYLPRRLIVGLYAASLAWASAGAVATEVAKKPAPAKIGGFVLKGEDSYSAFGHSVRGAGDVNGDGISDLILGAPAVPWDRTLEEGTGKSYVVFGSATGFPTAPEISALDGSNGFVLEGIAVGDSTGYSVDGAGDVNGDGVDDLIIGASSTPVGSGTGFVVYGSRLGFPALVRLASLNGINGFFLRGIPWEPAGDSVSGAGDVNGDGIDDLVIAAPGGHSGATPDPRQQDFYVVFGSAAGFPLLSYLSAINGSNGFGIKVEDASILQANLRSAAVGSAGDVNGDGIDDLVFGASQADPDGRLDAGESYVVFGSTAGFPVSLDFSALDGDNGFVLKGVNAHDRSGGAVSGAGDINGDGIDDLIIGAANAGSDERESAGDSYVVYGSTVAFPASLELSSLDGSNGFVIRGMDWRARTGWSVSDAGDINGDGVDDLVLGAPGGFTGSGSQPNDKINAYVVFGSAAGFPPILDLSTLDGSNGFGLRGIDGGDQAGWSVSGAGDLNGDGLGDLVIGAPENSPYADDPGDDDPTGESYVVFGASGDFPAVIELGPLQPVSVLVYGDCPGTVYFRAQGLTANGPYARIVSSLRGSAPITLGACTDVQTGLATTWLHGSDVADGSGSAQYGKSGVEVCGGFMQVIDLTTCELSEVVPLLPEAAAAGEAAAES